MVAKLFFTVRLPYNDRPSSGGSATPVIDPGHKTFQAKNDRLSNAARTGQKALDVNVRVETKATKLPLDLAFPIFSRYSLSSS
jgi:hypothetical protein